MICGRGKCIIDLTCYLDSVNLLLEKKDNNFDISDKVYIELM